MYANPYRKHDGKSVADMFPNLFEEDKDMGPGITEEEQNELLELMAAENARLEKERKSSEKKSHSFFFCFSILVNSSKTDCANTLA